MKFKSHFELYGERAKEINSSTVMNGRYQIQESVERLIPNDIISKLNISQNDKVLDVGCGAGLQLIEISKKCKLITACDHENVIQRILNKNQLNKNISLVSGNFLDINFHGSFDKIYAYSVLSTLPSKKELYNFIDKAITLLNPNGQILFGDIPNSNTKARFINSDKGKEFLSHWQKNMRENSQNKTKDNYLNNEADLSAVFFDDNLVFEILLYARKLGLNSYLLPQNPELPFGHTREDII